MDAVQLADKVTAIRLRLSHAIVADERLNGFERKVLLKVSDRISHGRYTFSLTEIAEELRMDVELVEDALLLAGSKDFEVVQELPDGSKVTTILPLLLTRIIRVETVNDETGEATSKDVLASAVEITDMFADFFSSEVPVYMNPTRSGLTRINCPEDCGDA